MLRDYPDQQAAQVIIHGISEGFCIGFDYTNHTLQSCDRNMVSARQHPEVVSDYLSQELELGRISKLSSQDLVESLGIHISPFGVIPKRHKPGKWRLILDLSSPEGKSVNDGIHKDTCSLSYTSVDEVVECILMVGKGALLAKMDVMQAYRNVPVHPQDRFLLGMRWQDTVFVDNTLPFGLRSAPLIFSAIADMLQWIMHSKGVEWLFHYIDDFITVGRPRSQQCRDNVGIMRSVCKETGTPQEEAKFEGPATVIEFLGIELDTEALEIRLSQTKLQTLVDLLSQWRGKKVVRKRDLLSIIGSLSHACKVVKPGRAFLRRLINLSMVAHHLDHHIRLNREARSDIEWWYTFAHRWNGVAMFSPSFSMSKVDAVLTSDASGSWGCGAYSGSQWFQLQWVQDIKEAHITLKELVPIVIAAALWGPLWAHQHILAQCDNAAVVAIINHNDSKIPEAMHLIRCRAFLAAKYQFSLKAVHISGSSNNLADALSRNNHNYFLLHYPQANPLPQLTF